MKEAETDEGLELDEVSGEKLDKFRVLYLFDGRKRWGDLRHHLKEQCKKRFIDLDIDEYDVSRKKSHTLLNNKLKDNILEKVKFQSYDFVITSPPCSTFSRVRSANSAGPPPLRSRRFPRGLPWNSLARRQAVKEANALVNFTAQVLEAQTDLAPLFYAVMEHPEDLGMCRSGADAASVWQLENIKALLRKNDVVQGAFNQSIFGTKFQKPTRLLWKAGLAPSWLVIGEPKFDGAGFYIGPPEAASERCEAGGQAIRQLQVKGDGGVAASDVCGNRSQCGECFCYLTGQGLVEWGSEDWQTASWSKADEYDFRTLVAKKDHPGGEQAVEVGFAGRE